MERDVQRAPSVTHSAPAASRWEAVLTPDMLFRAGVLLLIALYLRTLTFDFVYDDLLIPLNPWIQSWHGVIDAFRSDIWGFNAQNATSYYRPLPAALGVVIARLSAPTPGWFHLSALLIEIALCAACYWCGKLLLEDEWLAALTTVLFILHPTKVETVAWIGSSECDGQAAVYLFTSFACYLKWWSHRKWTWAAGSIVFVALAVFTKETMVLAPLLFAIHYVLRWRDSRSHRSAFAVVSGYAVAVLAYMLARHAVLKPLSGENISVQAKFGLVNVWTAPSVCWWYLRHFLWPVGLGILYDFHPVAQPGLREFALPLLVMIVLLLALGWAWKRSGSWRVPFLAAWFGLLIGAPVALAPGVTVHDRYLQLPAYALCAGVAWLLLGAIRRQTPLRGVGMALALALVAFWSIATWHESGFWDNSLNLWQRAVEVAPHSVNARVELARLVGDQQPDEAVRILDGGLQLVPDSPGLWRARGLTLFNAGEYEEARTSLMRSLEASERFHTIPGREPADVKYGRATAAFFIGQIDMVEGKPQAADAWLRMATSIAPNNLEFARTMVRNLHLQGREAEAKAYQDAVDRMVAHTTMR